MDAAIAAYLEGTSDGIGTNRPHILKISRTSLGPGTPSQLPNFWGYSVQVEPHSLVVSTLSQLPSHICESLATQHRKNLHIWIPGPILENALPALVDRFHSVQPKHSQVSVAKVCSLPLSCYD